MSLRKQAPHRSVRDGHIYLTDRQVAPPSKRPRCKYCGKPLKPFVLYRWEETTDSDGTIIHTKFEWDKGTYGYLQQGTFCGPKCGYNYGMQCLKHPGRM